MGSNRFHALLFTYVGLIFLCAFGTFYFLMVRQQPNTAVFIAAVAILVALRLVYHVNRTNRLLANFLTYLQEEDTSLSYSAPRAERSFRGLQRAMEKLIGEFKEHRIELQVQARYLEAVLDNVSAGIICHGTTGDIMVMNRSACRLLGTGRLSTLAELENRAPELARSMRSLGPGNQDRLTLNTAGRQVQLLLQASRIKLKERSVHIFSLNDISHEMEEQEIRSWKKLIRVINHEIMNSITPIITVSRAFSRKLGKHKGTIHDQALKSTLDDAMQSVSIIEERSGGLVKFIDRYRTITDLPPVKRDLFDVQELLSRMKQLFSADCEGRRIRLVVPDQCEMVLEADRTLIEQVLINLLKNAMDAVKEVKNPEIELACLAMPGQGPCLSVRDNGTGIDADKLEQVFVPFFTTREEGSGIGLSLCRQIMRQHKGQIRLESEPGKGTTVNLIFH